MDLNVRIGQRLRTLRMQRGHTLDALATRSGVSRSNVALIESGRSSPTAVVLDRLATALEVTVASLFEDPAGVSAPSPLVRVADQPVWTDPGSGYVRRNVSPPGIAAPLQLVDVVFPARARVAFESAGRENDVHQQVWLIAGRMHIASGDERWELHPGDCLAMRLDRPNVFSNPGPEAARYLVALVGRDREPREDSLTAAINVDRLSPDEAAAAVPDLADILLDCVQGGASVSFMWPLPREKALAFWTGVAQGVARGERVLLAAREAGGRVVGTAQLVLAMPDNQPHRADVAKMLVHRSARRQGVAARLLAALDEAARAQGRSVLVLDTVTGGDAERLYARHGWQRVGDVPRYALMPDGSPCGTTFFYKHV